jgi:SprA-related family
MNVGMSNSYDIGTNYIMRLNDKEVLVSEEDPVSASLAKAKKAEKKKEQEEKKIQEAQKKSGPDELSEDEKRLVKDLAARDAEVKGHESAHQAAGGGMIGAASFTYQQGPDGKMYAIGGEVSISTPAASTPQEAIKNARQVAAAAMAAGDPSPQDFAVAASARVMEMKAQQQLAKEELEKMTGQSSYKDAQNSLNKSSSQQEKPLLDIPA